MEYPNRKCETTMCELCVLTLSHLKFNIPFLIHELTNPLLKIFLSFKSILSEIFHFHFLQDGVYCEIISAEIDENNILKVITENDKNSQRLKYSPPNYHSFGLPATQRDPFENNTVEVTE